MILFFKIIGQKLDEIPVWLSLDLSRSIYQDQDTIIQNNLTVYLMCLKLQQITDNYLPRIWGEMWRTRDLFSCLCMYPGFLAVIL